MNTAETKLGASFGWLNATQFLGALNDNIFRLLVVLFLIDPQDPSQSSSVMALALAVFVIPFLLFSALAGKLADSFSKRDIIVSVKVAEAVVMSAGFVAFMLESTVGLYLVLFMMAAQSAFFAPCKYGIVPELVKEQQLSRANALLVALTYLAIIMGIASPFVLDNILGGSFTMAASICIAIAVVGLIVSLPIRRTPSAGAERKASVLFIRDIWQTLWLVRRDRDLLLAVFASAYFLLVGGIISTNLIGYGIDHLGFNKEHSVQLFVIVAIGIGLGAWWAGRLSGLNVEFGIVPLGALGLTFSSAGLGLIDGSKIPAFVLIFLMGVSGGLFIVPIRAFIQLRSPNNRRGQILAASSFLSWVGVLLASGLIYLFCGLLGLSAAAMFVILAGMTFMLSVITVILLPDFLVRFICVALTRLCYRIKVAGIENIPSRGAALLVCNHVSWVDSLLLAATQQRRIRYVMERRFYNIKWLRPLCTLMKAIPISVDDGGRNLITSLKEARAAMDEGFIVCIFAEGAMTRTGMLRAFKAGFQRIMKGSSFEIIPTYIGGVWGSVFSYYNRKPLSMLPRKFPYPVSIHFGSPMPSDSTAAVIRQKVAELSCDYFNSLKQSRRSLADHFVRTARKNWRRRCISDSTGRHLDYGQALVSTVVLSKAIKATANGTDKIGILLPPSAVAAFANLAVGLLGKVAVNLNYTASPKARQLAVSQCHIKCIISSRSFIERIEGLQTLPGVVFMEDITTGVKLRDKVAAYLKARFLPRRFLTKWRGFRGDDLATVIYSSGSSGTPKGICLSHHNILSNIEAIRMVFQLRPDDDVCAVLPFFHSFGYTCALWLPLISGVSVGFCANPLDGDVVGRMARQNHSTLLFAAPTFLLNYTRRANKEDFAGLRLVVVGAEKLKKTVSDAFEARFGIRPMEGYGTTELSPVVSLNLPDVESRGVYQLGNKEGTVGHPLPGVAVKIVDAENGEALSTGAEGLLLVKGPNVMLGYLGMEEKTAEVVKDGWYNTCDIGRIDEDGFLMITDRLSRFSKIAGEMVSHVGIEQVYLQAIDTSEQVVAVTSVPDARKGEELVVLYSAEAGDADSLHEIMSRSELPNMWKPRRSNYIKTESIPVLGSGKLDLVKLRKIAQEAKSSFND